MTPGGTADHEGMLPVDPHQPDPAETPLGELDAALARLTRQFPDVPGEAVTALLGDSYQQVVEISGRPLVDKAEQLARLRLEVRTRHPALVA